MLNSLLQLPQRPRSNLPPVLRNNKMLLSWQPLLSLKLWQSSTFRTRVNHRVSHRVSPNLKVRHQLLIL
jgi:hypothetical protein